MKERIEMTVKSSEIKKGDFVHGCEWIAESDAYRHSNGIWSFDIYDGYRYGIQQRDVEVIVSRIIK